MDVRAPPRATYVFGPFRLDAAHGSLTRDGEPVVLTSRVFSTLLYLVENAGRISTKDDMLHALWPGRIADEANLSQAVSAVRKALGQGGAGEALILTVPGRGYRFSAPVRIEEPTAPAIAPPPDLGEEKTPPVSLRPGRRAWPAAAAVAAALIAAGALAWLDPWGLAPWRASHLPAGRTSAVVADLQNSTGEPVFDHVLRKALQIDLGQSPFLDVANDAKIADTLDLMGLPRHAPLTADLAQNVCARTNGGAVIASSIAGIGGHYLLTLAATDCVDGRTLDAEKQEAAGKEAVIGAVDRLAGRLRRKLGEPAASVARFDVPLMSQRTGSFAALQAYSEGVWLHDHDRLVESIAMFQHAIELDPNFAMAHAALALDYYDARQPEKDADEITKAYRLRNLASEPEKLFIVARYNHSVTKDVEAAISNFKIWTDVYPKDAVAWASLSNLENWVGRYSEAVTAGQHAVALNDRAIAGYSVLMRALAHSNQLARAQTVGAQAMAKGISGGDTVGQLIGEAYLRGQRPVAQKLIDDSTGKPVERDALLEAADLACADGRMRLDSNLLQRAIELGRPQGLEDTARSSLALCLALVGLNAQSLALLKTIPPDLRNEDYRYAQALVGDPARVEADLARELKQWPQDTLLNGQYAPQIRAAILLRRGRNEDAAKALAVAAPYAHRVYDILYQQGNVSLDVNDLTHAAAAFRYILADRGLGPGPEYDLSYLGLARTLQRQGAPAASLHEYETFFTAWKDADPDLPILRQAKAEYVRLKVAADARLIEAR